MVEFEFCLNWRGDGTRGETQANQQASDYWRMTKHGGAFSSAVVFVQSLVGQNRRNNLRWGIAVRQAGAGSPERFRVTVRSKMGEACTRSFDRLR